MFTGIVEGVAKVESVSKLLTKKGKGKGKAADTKLVIHLGKLGRGLKVGDSVSVNGACLTVTKLSRGKAEFEMVGETTKRTNLGLARQGDKVNIERSLRLGERLEGHFVLGHVDGTGMIEKITRTATETKIWIRIENKDLLKSIVPKGSITVDGISLTVVDIEGDRISVSIIPHTLKVTTLGLKSEGDKVNIETDILAKYILSLPKK